MIGTRIISKRTAGDYKVGDKGRIMYFSKEGDTTFYHVKFDFFLYENQEDCHTMLKQYFQVEKNKQRNLPSWW